ncbi:tetratricopeptide repeat protein [Streptomyces virginiae]|uniref:tetratricopeptide repeat protein n=1 Tax=Streptomyces virginiae TaxID=1961 RepID=UPI00341E571A
MTTAAGLPAVRESLQLALLADPHGSAEVAELADAAVEHYALTYPKHPAYLLFEEVRAARGMLTDCLVTGHIPGPVAGGLHRNVGWLSALMGNLAFHLDDHTGARAHLATATAYGTRTDDARLTAWALGAQSMVARAENRYESALAYAERAVAHAPAGLPKAQAHAWAQLTSLAGLGREQEADTALAAAARELEADPTGFAPGRFGFDPAEYTLHQAESAIALGHHNRARTAAETSIGSTAMATPGWAAATLSVGVICTGCQPMSTPWACRTKCTPSSPGAAPSRPRPAAPAHAAGTRPRRRGGDAPGRHTAPVPWDDPRKRGGDVVVLKGGAGKTGRSRRRGGDPL